MSTYKNSDGRWMVDVKIRVPGEGRPKRLRRVSPVQTKRGADKYERELRSKIVDEGWDPTAPAPEPAPTLEQWAEIFAVEHSEAKQLRPSSIREQRGAFRLYVIPILGGSTRVDTIGTPHFDRMRRGMSARGLTPKTINNASGVLSRAVRFFYERQGLDVPSFDACRVRVPKSPPKVWAPDTYKTLVACAAERGPATLAIVLLMGDCGLRAGEVIGLEWSHITAGPKPQLVIQRSFTDGHFGPPKYGRSRTLPVTMRAAAALGALPRALRAPWVLTRVVDGEISHRNHKSLSWAVRTVEHAAGVGRPGTDGQLHRLRHTYITRLAAAGVPARDIMELAGHTSLSTTLRYMHQVPGAAAAAVEALERFDQNGAAGQAEMKPRELGQDRGRAQRPK